MEVGLGPGDFVLDGDPVAPPKRGTAPNFRPVSIVAKRLPISATAAPLFEVLHTPLCTVYLKNRTADFGHEFITPTKCRPTFKILSLADPSCDQTSSFSCVYHCNRSDCLSPSYTSVCCRIFADYIGSLTHRRSVAERGGCFQWCLFVCEFVSLSVCLFCSHDDFRTIQLRMMKLDD